MSFRFLLVVLCIGSLAIATSALDCNWMSCYATELKDCSQVAYKEECATGVFVVYKEAPLFFSKRKCCKDLTLEKAKSMFLYCVKTLQNATHTCHSYEDRDMQIATKNNCNRFGCAVSSSDGEKKGSTGGRALSSTTASGLGHPTATESTASPLTVEHTSVSTEFRVN